MAMWKTTAAAQLWTKAQNKAEIVPTGTILELSGNTMIIKDRLCLEIISANYVGKYIEPRFLVEYSPDPEPPPGETMPPPDEAEFHWKNSAGEVVISQIWTPKK